MFYFYATDCKYTVKSFTFTKKLKSRKTELRN